MSVRISVESLSGCAWNGCPSQRGIRNSSNVSAGVGWMTLFPSTIAVVAGSLPFGVNPPLLRCCRYRFRSYSGSLLADAPKVSKRSVPLPSGPTSSGSLAPSSFQGHAAKGHPWPIAALAASMPLNPLHNDSTRPPDGAFGVVCEIGDPAPNRARALRLGRNALALSSAFAFLLCLPQHVQTPRSPNPVRRPSGGAVERGVWHGCQTRSDGPGMALRDDPRNSAGARGVERSETRMPGALSLWLLSARVKRNGAKRSNSRRLARRASEASQVTRRKGEKVHE